MIKVENLSYGFPAKDLYKDISFTLEADTHAAVIGSNGTGKSTLANIIMNPDDYLYDGKVIKDENCRVGYASQFSTRDKLSDRTVFDFLSQRFMENQEKIAAVCEEMATAEDMDEVFGRYQALLDLNEAMDGDNYESNIRKQLYIVGMTELEETKLSDISGGEYKILQIMREMLLTPNVLILDEPDVFLDFANLNSLCKLINEYKGTMMVITHNRYLLNHCFNKILHIENCDLQEYDGCYSEYRCAQLNEKLEIKIKSIEDEEEIQRTEEMVEILRDRATLMVNPTIGRSVNAKQTQLDRLLARQIKAPFIEVREPQIVLPDVETGEERPVLTISDYKVSYDKNLLEDVNFELMAGEKVAIVGANGTGKTTLVRDILNGCNPSIKIDENVKVACLSQLQGETMEFDRTVYQVMQDADFGGETAIKAHLAKYCLEWVDINQKVGELSVGEQNLLQLAMVSKSDADMLVLDEPSSHLDIYAQMALEKAISEYKGTVLLVSHDFYLIANCADYVLFIEDNTIRRMRARTFRKMVYDKYFDSSYLELDRKKQELETDIAIAFKKNRLETVRKLLNQLMAL
ncbi:MAG: ATP-binding cassette domain-containing protein [Firmicutes bacterium]|nr:ATP-binding cassette domain-containing protein [Bacillota bacterium]